MSLEGKLDRVVDRHKELERLLSDADGSDSQTYAKLSKEYSDLTPVVEGINALRNLRSEIEDLGTLIGDADTDGEMREMAAAELEELRAREPAIEGDLQIMLLPKDAADARNARSRNNPRLLRRRTLEPTGGLQGDRSARRHQLRDLEEQP